MEFKIFDPIKFEQAVSLQIIHDIHHTMILIGEVLWGNKINQELY